MHQMLILAGEDHVHEDDRERECDDELAIRSFKFATGTTNWTYTWTAHGSPSTTIRTRASDDSANVETPRAGNRANVSCPCSIFSPATAPANPDSNDAKGIEAGMRFTSDTAGVIRSIRFYKAPTNTGTHSAHLWSATGQLLGSASFTNESASGWQQADFATPIAIAANTTYIASYYAPSGHYSEAEGYFFGPPAQPDFVAAVDSRPLHALPRPHRRPRLRRDRRPRSPPWPLPQSTARRAYCCTPDRRSDD